MQDLTKLFQKHGFLVNLNKVLDNAINGCNQLELSELRELLVSLMEISTDLENKFNEEYKSFNVI